MSSQSNMFKMGSIWLPNPSTKSCKQIISTFVNSGRNAQAQVTAQKIGRDQVKLELAWDYLTVAQWSTMLTFWNSNFTFNFEYFDAVTGLRATRECYIGDRSALPLAIDANGSPTGWIQVTANFIDTGR